MPQAVVSKMRHRADIERDASTGTNDWNTAPSPDFQTHLSGVKCFAWSTSRKELVDDVKTAVFEVLRCIMPLATDVTEADRITAIKDRSGTTVLSGPLRIEAVQRQHTHLELILERIDG